MPAPINVDEKELDELFLNFNSKNKKRLLAYLNALASYPFEGVSKELLANLFYFIKHLGEAKQTTPRNNQDIIGCLSSLSSAHKSSSILFTVNNNDLTKFFCDAFIYLQTLATRHHSEFKQLAFPTIDDTPPPTARTGTSSDEDGSSRSSSTVANNNTNNAEIKSFKASIINLKINHEAQLGNNQPIKAAVATYQTKLEELTLIFTEDEIGGFASKHKEANAQAEKLKAAGIILPELFDENVERALKNLLNAFALQHEKEKGLQVWRCINLLETALQPQLGWRLGGALPGTMSSLSVRNQILIAMLKDLVNPEKDAARLKELDATDQKVVLACCKYWGKNYRAESVAESVDDSSYKELLRALEGGESKDQESNSTMVNDTIKKLKKANNEIDQSLKEIAENYHQLDTDKKADLSNSRRLWTGLYYNGKYQNAAYRNVVKRGFYGLLYLLGTQKGKDHYALSAARRTQRHFMALCERLAIIHPSCLQAIYAFTEASDDEGLDHYGLIEKLHEQFERVQTAYLFELDAKLKQCKENLMLAYEADNLAPHMSKQLEFLIEALLLGKGTDDKVVADILEEFRKYNKGEEGFKYRKNRERIVISRLLHDCKYHAKQLAAERKSIHHNLKELKKDINRIAQDLDVPLHIINPSKETLNKLSSYHELLKHLIKKHVSTKLKAKTLLQQGGADSIKSLIRHALYQIDKDDELTDKQKKALKAFAENQVKELGEARELASDADADADLLKEYSLLELKCQTLVAPYRTHIARPAGVSALKQKKRKIKKWHKTIARGASMMVGVGEGSVAAVGFLGLIATPAIAIPLAIFVGLTAIYCNKVLVEKDIYDTLNELFLDGFLKRLFRDEDGNEISRGRKAAVIGFGMLSFGCAFTLSALSAASLTSRILLPLLQLILAHKVAIGIALALSSGPLGATAIGLTALFFVVIADLVKNWPKRQAAIVNYFKTTYGINHDRWNDVKARSPFGRLAALIDLVIFQWASSAVKLLLALTLCAAITIVGFGVFYKDGLNLLHTISKASWTSIATYTLDGMSAVVNAIFGFNKQKFAVDNITIASMVVLPLKAPVYVLGVVFAAAEAVLRILLKPLAFLSHKCFGSPLLGRSPNVTGRIVRGVIGGLDWFGRQLESSPTIPWLKFKPWAKTYEAQQLQEMRSTSQLKTSSNAVPTYKEAGKATGGRIALQAQISNFFKSLFGFGCIIPNTVGQVGTFAGNKAGTGTLTWITGGHVRGIPDSIAAASSELTYSAIPQGQATVAALNESNVRQIDELSPPTGAAQTENQETKEQQQQAELTDAQVEARKQEIAMRDSYKLPRRSCQRH